MHKFLVTNHQQFMSNLFFFSFIFDWLENVLLSIIFKCICTSVPIMNYIPIKQQSYTPKNITNIHKHKIKNYLILITPNLEFHLALCIYQDLKSFLQPRNLVGSWVYYLLQIQLIQDLDTRLSILSLSITTLQHLPLGLQIVLNKFFLWVGS